MDQEPIEIDEKQLKILATQLGIVFPSYDSKYESEDYPTTDPGPGIIQSQKNFAELV
ncbi:MAG: hypothetical protein LHV69_09120 [Elusimicrobia bacterium]|nr:hypothetical protein [Candidatus Obscuribacterium magneticum]